MMKKTLVAAVTENRVIGKDGGLVYRIKADQKRFRELTLNHHVLMGRKTYDSLPKKFRPLPNRMNLIISRDIGYKIYHERARAFYSIENAILYAEKQGEQELFIIGGEEIYKQTICLADELNLTEISSEVEGDAYFPDYSDWNEKSRKDYEGYSFVVYTRD